MKNFIFTVMIMFFAVKCVKSQATPKVTGKEVWKLLTDSMFQLYFECNQESEFSSEVIEDVIHFWDMTHEFNHTEIGCLLLCLFVKLEIVGSQTQLMTTNLTELLEIHGGDPPTVNLTIDLFKFCYSMVANKTKYFDISPCLLTLEFSKCVRDGVKQLKWTPDTSAMVPLVLEKYKSLRTKNFKHDSINREPKTYSSPSDKMYQKEQIQGMQEVLNQEIFQNTKMDLENDLLFAKRRRQTRIFRRVASEFDPYDVNMIKLTKLPSYRRIPFAKLAKSTRYNFLHWRRSERLNPIEHDMLPETIDVTKKQLILC